MRACPVASRTWPSSTLFRPAARRPCPQPVETIPSRDRTDPDQTPGDLGLPAPARSVDALRNAQSVDQAIVQLAPACSAGAVLPGHKVHRAHIPQHSASTPRDTAQLQIRAGCCDADIAPATMLCAASNDCRETFPA